MGWQHSERFNELSTGQPFMATQLIVRQLPLVC
jgi:hypothetical protein